MSENKIKALEEKGEKLESKIDSNREQINANLEAICWMRKLVLKLNKQKIFFWQLKKEISELEKRYESHSHPQVEMRIEKLEEKYKEMFKTVHGIYPDKVDTYEEIMRKHLKSHIVVAREQLTDKDKLTIFREFDEAIQKQLEKLEEKEPTNITLSEAINSVNKDTNKMKKERKKRNEEYYKEIDESIPKEPTELYELYMKDKEQFYFRKTTHPFTQLNNMVHLGIGEMKMERADLENGFQEALERFYEILEKKPFKYRRKENTTADVNWFHNELKKFLKEKYLREDANEP